MKARLESAVTWKVPNEITLGLQVVHFFLESLDKTQNHIEKDKYGVWSLKTTSCLYLSYKY